jgi:hypothetical protein
MNTEELIIEYESCLNEAIDRWFNARPLVERTPDAEFIFTGGFRLGSLLILNEED